MDPADETRLDLVRELRTSAQLQHAWLFRVWQHATGLHPAAAGLLAELGRHGESRPSDIAKRKMVDLSVVSRQISQLVEAGLVERRPAPEDGRAALVRVSEAGERELDRWRELHGELARRALGGWPDDELRALVERLRRVNGDLRAVLDSDEPGAREPERAADTRRATTAAS